MSVLARNLKTIRKGLRCTQSVMADILKVGFRTYVRYEAGERDAPVSILVKIARLGNISLEQLLTREIRNHDILPLKTLNASASLPEVKRVDFRSGTIVFKKPAGQGLITLDEAEKKLLSLFRHMDPETQEHCLKNFGKIGKAGRKAAKGSSASVKASRGGRNKTQQEKNVSARAAVKGPKGKKKGKPGRKKLDKKLLREKIDRLKLITKSIQKITVR